MGSLIDDLQKAENLPDKTKSVSLIQTHISLVFITDEFVYKVKKPVNFTFLDFSTLEKRKYYCEQETKLNSRLSQDLYLSILPVRFNNGVHQINEGDSEVVDYAIKMKRIPDEQLMKFTFERDELTDEHLKNIACRIAEFHKTAETSEEITRFGEPDVFKVNTDENFEQTEEFVGKSITPEQFDSIKNWTNDFYAKNNKLFFERIKNKKVRDCHGDLHMMHICLNENLDIIDCIEFNDRFRYSDTLADIGFLMMDLDYHDGQKFSQKLWVYYKEQAGEKDVDELLKFYMVYRAYVRGKVNSFTLNDPNVTNDDKQKAKQLAAKYFTLAFAYLKD